jgi:hypothetical protein
LAWSRYYLRLWSLRFCTRSCESSLDTIATRQRDQAKLRAEVLALRRHVQVLERQIKRVKWTPADRMVLAAHRHSFEYEN